MKVFIIEDEPHAAARLENLISELLPDAKIVGKVDSVKQAVAWFTTHDAPDVALMDIQLADGLSFGIFEQCKVSCPVVFTTAYDQYAVKAFKVNGVDYILKPVDKDELSNALKKVSVSTEAPSADALLQNIGAAVQMLMKKYKTRFVIKVGEHLRTIEVDNIHYFYSQDKATFCVTAEGRNFILDFTIEQLEEMLNPEDFFRINRKYFVRASAIQDIISYTNSRLRLVLKGSDDSDIIVARERVQEFRQWLDR
jgi:DNA-binding LytR/AlgR family response regulator